MTRHTLHSKVREFGQLESFSVMVLHVKLLAVKYWDMIYIIGKIHIRRKIRNFSFRTNYAQYEGVITTTGNVHSRRNCQFSDQYSPARKFSHFSCWTRACYWYNPLHNFWCDGLKLNIHAFYLSFLICLAPVSCSTEKIKPGNDKSGIKCRSSCHICSIIGHLRK